MDGFLIKLQLISAFKDLTDLVERVGEYYRGIGEHSDLWGGKLEVDGVPTPVVRPSSFHVFLLTGMVD